MAHPIFPGCYHPPREPRRETARKRIARRARDLALELEQRAVEVMTAELGKGLLAEDEIQDWRPEAERRETAAALTQTLARACRRLDDADILRRAPWPWPELEAALDKARVELTFARKVAAILFP